MGRTRRKKRRPRSRARRRGGGPKVEELDLPLLRDMRLTVEATCVSVKDGIALFEDTTGERLEVLIEGWSEPPVPGEVFEYETTLDELIRHRVSFASRYPWLLIRIILGVLAWWILHRHHG